MRLSRQFQIVLREILNEKKTQNKQFSPSKEVFVRKKLLHLLFFIRLLLFVSWFCLFCVFCVTKFFLKKKVMNRQKIVEIASFTILLALTKLL